MTVEIHKRVYDQKLLGSLNLDNEILERIFLSRGITRAEDLYKSLKKHKPQFLFTTGAYIAPVSAIVSKLLKVNFYIQEQNIYSGLGNKLSAPFAKIVYTSFPDTKNIQKNKIQYCGPVLNLELNNNNVRFLWRSYSH